MKKRFVVLIGLMIGIIWARGAGAEKIQSVGALPPVVAQVCGQANTVTMWHDIDNDGQADYKATYVFKGGKLHQMSKSAASREELGLPIRIRQ
jgi:hypothetical protein